MWDGDCRSADSQEMSRAHAEARNPNSGLLAEKGFAADGGFAEAVVDVEGFEDEFAGAHQGGGVFGVEIEFLGETVGGEVTIVIMLGCCVG